MTHIDWNSLQEEQLNPLVTRKAIHTKSLTIARLRLAKTAVVPEHSHIHEQIASVEQGSLEFQVGGERIIINSGQSLAIPPNVPHSVVALEDTVVVDVFSPSREDWLRGEDAYLRK